MKIKDLSTLRFLVLSLLCFFSIEIFAFDLAEYGPNDPPATVAIDNQKNGNRPDSYLVSCLEEIMATISATNLIYEEGYYVLPSTATPIYVRLIIGNDYDYITPVEFFELSSEDVVDGFNLYTGQVYLPTPFEDICYHAELEDELGEDNSTDVNFQIFLVDVNGDPYPYWDNDDPNLGIFSCLVFCEDCLEGENDSEVSCIPSDPYEGSAAVDCSPCILSIPPEDQEGPITEYISQSDNIDVQEGFINLSSNENSNSNNHDLKKISSNQSLVETTIISPNPFQDEVNIRFSNQENEDIKINIFDSKGQVIVQKIEREVAQQEVIINSNTWEQGLYIITY